MIACIILAAGASTRMGTPKQLLSYRGKTLLEHAIQKLEATGSHPIYVVLGAHAAKVQPVVEEKAIRLVINKDWQDGMSSTLKRGIQAAIKDWPNLEATLIMLVDQPEVSTVYLNRLIETFRHSGKEIVASRYANRLGVPAIFGKSVFAELLSMQGQAGARYMIQKYQEKVMALDFPQGVLDLDTPQEWQNWLRSQGLSSS